jgi:hypothetical protein
MLTFLSVKSNRKQLESLVGMKGELFELLHNYYEVHWNNYINHYTVSGQIRTRPHRERKDGVLESSFDQLLFILHYLKGNTLQEHHAASYGMSQPQANVWIHLLLRLLRDTLKELKQLPGRKASKLKELLASTSEIWIDGTERDIQRPMDNEVQREHYSGKKNA